MTKADVVKAIAGNTGLDKAAVLLVVEQFMSTVKESLSLGENVYLRGFGSFIVKERAQKIARNITANESIVVPAHKIPAFVACKEFKQQVAEQ